jgi:hypothetical protein
MFNNLPTSMNSPPAEVSFEVRKLLCGSGRAGRMEHGSNSTWDLSYFQKTAFYLADSDSDSDNGNDEEESVASEGSRITLNDVPIVLDTLVRASIVTPVTSAYPLASTTLFFCQ